jgi:hypothetical protein
MNKTPTSSSLFAALQESTPGTFKPTRVPDAAERVLGTMSPELQCIWEQREFYHQAVDELASRFSDRARLLMTDLREQGEDLPADALAGYKEGLKKILAELRYPAMCFSVFHGMFHKLAQLDFGVLNDDYHFAARVGYQVICRTDDARNDNRPPLLELARELNLGVVGVVRLTAPDLYESISRHVEQHLDTLGAKQEPPTD